MLPDAPLRLSTTICWPSGFASSFATIRATRSTLPPGGNGEMMRIGLLGYVACAKARPDTTKRSRDTTAVCIFLTMSHPSPRLKSSDA